jgi:hypothetical protein
MTGAGTIAMITATAVATIVIAMMID